MSNRTVLIEDRDPQNWLFDLEQDGAMERLANESGDLVYAAWRVARARTRARRPLAEAPTTTLLMSAALEIAERVGWRDVAPTVESLTERCALSGLPVETAA